MVSVTPTASITRSTLRRPVLASMASISDERASTGVAPNDRATSRFGWRKSVMKTSAASAR